MGTGFAPGEGRHMFERYRSAKADLDLGPNKRGLVMHYVLSILLLPPIVLPAARAQDNEAEKPFRAMEKKIKDADAIQVSDDIPIRAIKGREKDSKIGNGVSKGKGALLLTKDNQARVKISNEYMGMTLISDGKRLKLGGDRGDLGDVKALPTPSHLHNLLNMLVRRVGVTAGSMIARFAPGPQFKPIFLTPGEKDFDAEKVEGWGVWDFKAGAAMQIGGRDAKAISYKVGPNGGKDSVAVTLWFDAKTLLPLKSVVVIGIENMHITETYREFKLDPKIDAKAFTLVPQVNEAEKLFRAVEEKINTAKAVQVTVEYAAKTKGKEEKFKGNGGRCRPGGRWCRWMLRSYCAGS
jgi:outer membrane lipoprotein-sorting protein